MVEAAIVPELDRRAVAFPKPLPDSARHGKSLFRKGGN